MKKFIIDSSVLVKFISQDKEEDLNKAEAILRDLKNNKIQLITSSLAMFEIGNALWKKKINPKTVVESFKLFFKLPLEVIETDYLLASIAYKVAYQYKVTFYDSVFLALAIQKKCSLITANPKHQKNFGRIKVIPLSNYS